jgi:hypothetical protein
MMTTGKGPAMVRTAAAIPPVFRMTTYRERGRRAGHQDAPIPR